MSEPPKRKKAREKLSADDAWAKIIELGQHLRILRSLGHNHMKRVSEAIEILQNVQTTARRRDYQVFLYDVLCKSGPQAVLLCAIALGQIKVSIMNPQHKRDLIRRLENGKDDGPLNYPTIKSLAMPITEVNIGENPISLQEDTDGQRSMTAPPSEPESDPIATPGVSPDTNCFTPQQHLVLEKTSPEGLADVFDEFNRAQCAVATFEGAILFASESIPGSKEREAWMSSCLHHLRLLKPLSCINEGDGRRSKRKRGASQEGEPDASDGRNRVNLQEGDAAALHTHPSQPCIGPIYQGGATEEVSPGVANFGVVPQVQNSGQVEESGMNIAFAAILPEVDKMEGILGQYLFQGMGTSCARHEEEESGLRFTTNAVRLYPANQLGGDFKLEVMLNFETGREIWEKAYPRIP